MSGAIMGLIGVAIWSAVSVAVFTTFVGVPLVFGMVIPAIAGSVAVLIVAASADIPAPL